MSLNGRALEGLNVLDCSQLLPGPLLGKILQDQGATVVKIENPFSPDPAKKFKPYYENLNGKKEIIELNLKDPEDYRNFSERVADTNLLIEAYRPETKKRLGLDSTSLFQINPTICIASLVGYPSHTPLSNRAAHDINFLAQSGALSLFSGMPGLPLADLFGAYQAAFRVVCALKEIERTKVGICIEVSLFEAIEELQSKILLEYKTSGNIPSYGNTLFTGKFPCYRIYSCKNGEKFVLGAIERKFWEKFCKTINRPDLVDEGYAEGPRAKEVILEVENTLSSKNWKEWELVFEEANCCVDPILNYRDVYGL